MSIQEKLIYFKQKQEEIQALHAELAPKKQALIEEAQAKVTEIDKEYGAKITELMRPLENKASEYKAETKSWMGIADGEKTNVLDLATVIVKLMEHTGK